MLLETELFKVVNVPMQDTIEKFVQLATVKAEDQKEHFMRPVRHWTDPFISPRIYVSESMPYTILIPKTRAASSTACQSLTIAPLSSL